MSHAMQNLHALCLRHRDEWHACQSPQCVSQSADHASGQSADHGADCGQQKELHKRACIAPLAQPRCSRSDDGRSRWFAHDVPGPKGCVWRRPSAACASQGNASGVPLEVGDIYLLGNSVTRHYAFALRDVITSGRDLSQLDRKAEKSSCHGVLGTSSCSFAVAVPRNAPPHSSLASAVKPAALPGPMHIHFYWKHYLGEGASRDDRKRDVCMEMGKLASYERGKLDEVHALGQLPPTERCLKALFSKAIPHDVLVVGSILRCDARVRPCVSGREAM